MRLHENKQLFAQAITAAGRPIENGGLGIKPLFIEKDYWISRSLKLMAQGDSDNRAIFKGGTSLSKAYGIGARFSEDIDVAISEAWTLSGNQLKNLIRCTAHNMTDGLTETVIPGLTSKGSHYHKAFYTYPRVVENLPSGAIKAGQILVEINSFANPYPFEMRELRSLLTDFLLMTHNETIIEEYDMQPFTVAVLDKRRTLTEKLVSLIRDSLATDYIPQLRNKIRHFYDLHFLLQDAEVAEYLKSPTFKDDFNTLLLHDQSQFIKPEGWQKKATNDSPLITDFDNVWQSLENTYLSELPELAYKEIPTAMQIKESLQQILGVLKD